MVKTEACSVNFRANILYALCCQTDDLVLIKLIKELKKQSFFSRYFSTCVSGASNVYLCEMQMKMPACLPYMLTLIKLQFISLAEI